MVSGIQSVHYFQTVPEVNALWNGEAPRLLSDIDISVAVATPNGLITPIVKDAISLGLEEISTTVKVSSVPRVKLKYSDNQADIIGDKHNLKI